VKVGPYWERSARAIKPYNCFRLRVCVLCHIKAVENTNLITEMTFKFRFPKWAFFSKNETEYTKGCISQAAFEDNSVRMLESSTIEYCLLRYVPNVVSNEGVSIAVIFIDASDLQNGTCAMSLAADWPNKVRLLDPDSDLAMLAALLGEIRDRLLSPTERVDMIHQLEDSFSNGIQVSERRKCMVPLEPKSIDTVALALLTKTSNKSVGSSVRHGETCQA